MLVGAMLRQLVMMVHAMTGALALLAALWVFVDTLNAYGNGNGNGNRRRLRRAAVALAAAMWLTYLVGGHWYVAFYGAERDLITAGPWPAAHAFFMEMKEHVFLTLLLLATWLPIAAYQWRPESGPAVRQLVLWSSGLLVLGILVMEGAGALVALGVKLALLA